jgi:hypothetical protein
MNAKFVLAAVIKRLPSLLLIVTFAALGSPVQSKEISKSSGETHVRELGEYLDRIEIYEPIHFKHLSIFPLRLREGSKLRGTWLTLDAALDRGVLAITEKPDGGRVSVVSVVNQSRDDTVFLMSGEVFSGGKQSRTVRQDVVLAPGQRIDLDVFCVEARRWRGEAELASGKALLPQSIQKELRMGADQQRIWQEVARTNRALGAENATDSLELALNADGVRDRLWEVRKQIVPKMPDDTIGYMFLDGGRPAGAEFFGREDLAASLLPKLLDSYAVDVILQRDDISKFTDVADRDVAVDFFRSIQRAGSQRSATPGSGAGIRMRTDELMGEGISLGDLVVHYSVHSQPRFIPLPKPSPR